MLRAGDQVRINVQLIEAASDRHLWADIFDRKLEDVLALHSDVVRAIANQVKITLTPDEETRLASAREVNPETYELYLKGMFHLHKFTPEGFEKGLAYLNEAIEKDPDDPLPYAGLAIGYSMIAHGPSPPPDSYSRAEEAANKALALDPAMAQVAEVYASLAQIKLYQDWDWTGAEQAFNLALELRPNLAETRIHYGWYLVLMDRSEEAIVEMKRAKQFDPLLPILPTFLGWVYWSYGRYDEALEEARRALEINPNFPIGLYVLGLVYSSMGRYDESIEAHKKAGAIHPNWGWGLGYTYALAGQRVEALKVAAELKAAGNNWNTWGLAEIYATLGEIDEALHWIEEAYKTRHGYTPWIGWNPVFEPLRDDPRFQKVHQRLNLPE
ncbi:MAG: tetratricopeptide repeat protein [Candidatus Marinimicrobia bacterium]|nr:tetratricopeptide repeat protein [Candidatus Neomarinimicrobiota bacterium]